jgi:hypothetical protein
MNSTIDTSLGTSWKRNLVQGLSLACGLALAAVLAFGTPDWRDGPAELRPPATAPSVATPKYPDPSPAVMFIVGSDAERLALESALSERSLTGSAEASILVAEAVGEPSPYDILAGEVDPSVQIIDLRERRADPTK